MFSAISAIATLTRCGNAVAPTGWISLLFFTAVPLLLVFFGGTPDTYHMAGHERGTATSTSTTPGTTSTRRAALLIPSLQSKRGPTFSATAKTVVRRLSQVKEL
jgi:hypothetical protein